MVAEVSMEAFSHSPVKLLDYSQEFSGALSDNTLRIQSTGKRWSRAVG